MTFYFHGTSSSPLESIRRHGLRLRCHEASLTADLHVAARIYAQAHPPGPPAPETRAPQGSTAPPPGREAGGVFVLHPSIRHVAACPTARIWTQGPPWEIRGGLAKWVGSYCSLYRSAADAESAAGFSELFRAGRLYTSTAWKSERKGFVPVPASDVLAWLPATEPLSAWVKGCKASRRRSGLRAPAPLPRPCILSDAETAAIYDQTRAAQLRRLVRRATLSCLRLGGVRFIKADLPHPAPQDPALFLSRPEVESTLAGLQEIAPCEPLAELIQVLSTALTSGIRRREDIERALGIAESFTPRAPSWEQRLQGLPT